MYQIMLVDDEPVEIEAMTLLIQKNFPDLNVCCHCNNALDAITQSKFVSPDIIIMDINMPGPNGLQAIEEIRKILPYCHFIVLTAHNKFEYAHQAIQLGVDDYILKPVRRTEMTRIIEQILNKINFERKQKSESQNVLKVLEEIKPVIVQDIFRAIVFGNSRPELILNNFRLIGVQTEVAFCAVLRMQIQPDFPELEKAKAKFRQELSFHANMISNCLVSDYFVHDIVMLIPVDANAPAITETVNWRQNLIQHICSKTRHDFAEITVGIGSSRKIEQLNLSYRDALTSLHAMLREKTKENQLRSEEFTGMELGKTHESPTPQYSVLLEKQILERLVLTDRIKAAEYAQKIFDQITQSIKSSDSSSDLGNANTSRPHFLTLKNRICVLASNLIREVSNQIDLHMEPIQFQDMICDQINKSSDYQQLKHAFLQSMNSMIDQITQFIPSSSYLESRAIDYIGDHYQQNISLSDVAEALQISSYYLSRIFHQKTGVTFTDYLTHLRIEKAKEMLINEAISIKEISLSTGFNSQIYFSKVFRKATGMTPNEYRQQFKR